MATETVTDPAPAPASASANAPTTPGPVEIAFSIGWLLAGLLPLTDAPDSAQNGAANVTRVATSLLIDPPPPNVRARQVITKLASLDTELQPAGGLDNSISQQLQALASASNNGDFSTERISELAEAIYGNLAAASGRLGRAVGLGFDLAETCRLPRTATREQFEAKFGGRVVGIQEALADLSSSFPDHVGRAVSLSLALWQNWAAKPELSKRPIEWPHEGVVDALARQGEVWRALLSGDKLGKDMLNVGDYFDAIKTLGVGVIRRPWIWAFFVGFVAVVGVGVYLLITQKAALAKIGGGVLSVLGVAGITTGTLKRAFSDVANEVEAQVWGAELDMAIADAATVPPGDWRMSIRSIEAPPARGLDPAVASNARTVHKLSKAVSGHRRGPQLLRERKVAGLLHDKCEFHTGDGVIVRRHLARRLLAQKFLATDPKKLVAGVPGRLVSQHDDRSTAKERALVWTFRHGKIRHLQEHPDWEAAQMAANDSWHPNNVASNLYEDLPTPEIRHAADPRRLRRTERHVWRRLATDDRRRALSVSSRRFDLRRRPRSVPLARAVFRGHATYMPRDAYLSQIQTALELRISSRLRQQTARTPRSAPRPAGASRAATDQLFGKFGPDDWDWITTVVHDLLTKVEGSHPFGKDPEERRMGDRVKLILVGDWGTGTQRAVDLAEQMAEELRGAHGWERHVIHLGDVYYCGEPGEYRDRFMQPWPVTPDEAGICSWNLNGNHDMYSGGHGYFDLITNDARFSHQKGTSFFRLYNDHWQFIGLDTAYLDNDIYDLQVPALNRWVGVPDTDSKTAPSETPPAPSAAPSDQGDGCRTVLLSHHQLGSATAPKSIGAGIGEKTAAAIATGHVHAWFWGHEHRCFLFEPYRGVRCPVCVGNGGVPELLSHELTLSGAFNWVVSLITNLFKKAPWPPPDVQWSPDKRYSTEGPWEYQDDEGSWEALGYVVIELDGADGSAVYVDQFGHRKAIPSFDPGAPTSPRASSATGLPNTESPGSLRR